MNTKRDQQRDTRGQVEFLKRKMNEIDQGKYAVLRIEGVWAKNSSSLAGI